MNLDFLFDGIASALSYLYDLTSSYGLAIMLLTLGVMVLVTPLTLKSTRSMIAMQQMQPEIRKLQNKYKDDRQKLNEEMMAFYKEHDISPLGGCLPLIVQTPIFIILYRVLAGLTQFQPYGHDMGVAAGLLVRDPSGGGYYANFGTFDPSYLKHSTQLYKDLSVSRSMDFLGLDLADSFMQTLGDGFVHALPYLILVGIVGVSAWYQQRQIMARNAGNQTQINPQQQMIMKVMPFFLPFFSLTLPAGIVLYFVVSNLYRIGQQHFITRTMYSDAAKADRDAAFQAKLKKGGDDDEGNGSGQKGSKGPKGPKGPKNAGGPKGGGAKGGGNGAKGGGGAKGSGSPKGASRSRTAAKAGGVDVAKDDEGAATTRPGGRSPSRQAPSRTAPPAQNRSKSKKKRR